MRNFFGQFAPELLSTSYGHEIWDLYERGLLQTESALTGLFEHETGAVDDDDVMREIEDVGFDEAARRLRLQEAR